MMLGDLGGVRKHSKFGTVRKRRNVPSILEDLPRPLALIVLAGIS